MGSEHPHHLKPTNRRVPNNQSQSQSPSQSYHYNQYNGPFYSSYSYYPHQQQQQYIPVTPQSYYPSFYPSYQHIQHYSSPSSYTTNNHNNKDTANYSPSSHSTAHNKDPTSAQYFKPTIYDPVVSNKDLPPAQQPPPGQLPRILFQGDIIIVNSTDKVKAALEMLFKDGTAMSHGIGFDMEWKPSIGKGSPRNPTALIQLATDKVCVIFWMTYLDNKMPLELFDVLASPDILKIGQSLDSGDNERLSQEFHLSLTNSVDISVLAKNKGFLKTNLKEQTKVLLGKNLSKFLCTSNWADVRLTPAQIRYAATDPYVTFLLYHKLIELPDAPPPVLLMVGPPYEDEDDADLVSGVASLELQHLSNSGLGMAMSVKCPHCERYFMKKVQVYAHLDHAHFELLPTGVQTCLICSKQFKKYSALKIHQDMTGHFTDE